MSNKNPDPSGDYYDWRLTGQPERPWLLSYDKSLVGKILLCRKTPDGQGARVYFKFEEALELIKKIDTLTFGIPKIIYLVGWQFNGHDSKYPSLTCVNEALKSSESSSARDDLASLIRESRNFNTTVSLHINLFDAFEDSPLWEEYDKLDIFAKDRGGQIIFGEVHGGQRSTQISHAREWETGLTRKRIDQLLAMIPELIESKTIHIDAYHTARPLEPGECISPYLGYSREEEARAQRKVYRYFRDKGIDVTSEGAGFLRPDPFIGLQPFSWANEKVIRNLPNRLYCSTPLRMEEELLSDPVKLEKIRKGFFKAVLPWYFKNNRKDRINPLRRPGYIISPLPWKKEKSLAVMIYWKDRSSLSLPPEWKSACSVNLTAITASGKINLGNQRIVKGCIRFGFKKDWSYEISSVDL